MNVPSKMDVSTSADAGKGKSGANGASASASASGSSAPAASEELPGQILRIEQSLACQADRLVFQKILKWMERPEDDKESSCAKVLSAHLLQRLLSIYSESKHQQAETTNTKAKQPSANGIGDGNGNASTKAKADAKANTGANTKAKVKPNVVAPSSATPTAAAVATTAAKPPSVASASASASASGEQAKKDAPAADATTSSTSGAAPGSAQKKDTPAPAPSAQQQTKKTSSAAATSSVASNLVKSTDGDNSGVRGMEVDDDSNKNASQTKSAAKTGSSSAASQKAPTSASAAASSSSVSKQNSSDQSFSDALHKLIVDTIDVMADMKQDLTVPDVVDHALLRMAIRPASTSSSTHQLNGLHKILSIYDSSNAAKASQPLTPSSKSKIQPTAAMQSQNIQSDCDALKQFLTQNLRLCKLRSIQIFHIAKDMDYISHCVFLDDQPWQDLGVRLCCWAMAKTHPANIQRDSQIAMVAASIGLLSIVFKTPKYSWRADWSSMNVPETDVAVTKPQSNASANSNNTKTNMETETDKSEGTRKPPAKRIRMSNGHNTKSDEDMVFRLLVACNQLGRKLAWKSRESFCVEASRTAIFSQLFAMLYGVENSPSVQAAPAESTFVDDSDSGAIATHKVVTQSTLRGLVSKPEFLKQNMKMIIDSMFAVLGESKLMWVVPDLRKVDMLAKNSPKGSLHADQIRGAVTVTLEEGTEVAESKPSRILVPGAASERSPSLTDAMELNEWTLSILSLSVIRPSNKLVAFFEDDSSDAFSDIIVPTMNKALQRMLVDTFMGKGKPTSVSVGNKDGQLYFERRMPDDIQLVAAVVGLYYHSLESILTEEKERLKANSNSRLIRSIPFHRALLVCCYFSALKAVGCSRKVKLSSKHYKITIYTLLHLFETTPYTYLKVSESFCRSTIQADAGKQVRPTIIGGLPTILQRHIRRTEVQVLDSLIWAREPTLSQEGSLIQSINELKRHPRIDGKQHTGSWPLDVMAPTLPEEIEDIGFEYDRSRSLKPPPTSESQFLSFIFRKVMRIAHFRIETICSVLKIPKQYPVMSQIWIAFRYMLRHHTELLYDRHIDHLVLCAVYGICKVMGMVPDVTFVKLIDVYVGVRGQELGEMACQRIVRQICLLRDEDDGAVSESADQKPIGNIIEFYNRTYVPKMKKHLLYSKSLRRNTAVLAEALKKTKDNASASRVTASKPSNGPSSASTKPQNMQKAGATHNEFAKASTKGRQKDASAPSKIVQQKKGLVGEKAPSFGTVFKFGGSMTKHKAAK